MNKTLGFVYYLRWHFDVMCVCPNSEIPTQATSKDKTADVWVNKIDGLTVQT